MRPESQPTSILSGQSPSLPIVFRRSTPASATGVSAPAAVPYLGSLCPTQPMLQKVMFWLGGEPSLGSLSDMECDSEADADAQLSSMVCIRASEAFPLRSLQTEESGVPLPFPLLSGESATALARTADGVIALSTYRLFIHLKEIFFNIPLGLVESVESREIFYLYVYCKDARTIRCTFSSNEQCLEWHKRLSASIVAPIKLDDVFAFAYFAWHSEDSRDVTQQAFTTESLGTSFEAEVERMGFDLKSAWRISYMNSDYSLCGSYPREILVPVTVPNDDLAKVASFRSSRRIPAVVWRHQTNGAVIARCSQPEVGWLGWRNNVDESLLQAIAQACAMDGGNLLAKVEGEETGEKITPQPAKLLIIDARSYAAAVANRAKGGGCECPEYYPNCEIQFMSLANIHSIRRSFQSVRVLCGANSEQLNWYSGLENTKWLVHIAGLLKSALMVVNAVDREKRPVLVHCSDGWDRTPQIVALAELMLDPYYRTMHGFQVLVEREWLEFGHKFGDRCGHGLPADDTNERCPVFLQWLDCVHQLLQQFPCNFEFNSHFLVKLAQHTYSCLFGTFLCNSSLERSSNSVRDRTYSVWAFLQNHDSAARFRNYLYTKKDQVLRPSFHVRDLLLWSAVYLQGSDTTDEPVLGAPQAAPSLSSSSSSSGLSTPQGDGSDSPPVDTGGGGGPAASGPTSLTSGSLAKTRSCVDLLSLVEQQTQSRQRRSSVDGIQQRSGACTQDFSAVTKLEDDASEDDDVVVATPDATCAQPESTVVVSPLANGHSGLDTDDEDSADETLANRGSDRAQPTHLTNGYSAPPRDGRNRSDSDNDEEDDTEPTLSDGRSVTEWPPHPAIESSTDTLVGELAACGEQPLTTSGTPATNCVENGADGCERSGGGGCRTMSFSSGRCRDGEGEGGYVAAPTESLAQHVSTSTSDLSRCHVGAVRHPWSSCPAHGVDHHRPASATATVNGFGQRWDGSGVGVSDGGGKCVLCLNGSGVTAERRRCVMDANLEMLKQLSSYGRARSAQTPSRTPSSGFPATPSDERLLSDNGSGVGAGGGILSLAQRSGGGPPAVGRRLDVDGLSLSPDETQHRLHELVTEHQATRYTLQQTWCMLQLTVSHQKMCQRCCGSSRGGVEHADEVGSLAGSVSSGDQQSSLGPESTSASDVSWEQVDERETRPTLWVPDHAVSRCAGCSVEFCIVRRKHHCRNCGDIFCSDCSSQMLPIPNEQLYHPVRVCCTCFERLRGKLPQAQSAQPSAAFNDMKLPKAILAGTPSSN